MPATVSIWKKDQVGKESGRICSWLELDRLYAEHVAASARRLGYGEHAPSDIEVTVETVRLAEGDAKRLAHV